jgi:hypothetical protein
MALPIRKEVKSMNENITDVVNEKITRRNKPQFSESQRKKYYKDYQDSGLSVKKYCELNKISQSALRKWIQKFRSNSFFSPVSQSPSINHSNKQSFEVIFSSGIRLRFPELIDSGVISGVIKQLIKEVGSCN